MEKEKDIAVELGRDAAGGLGAKKYKPLVYIVAFTAALAGLLFGLDIGVISGALKFIAKAFSASTLQQELGGQFTPLWSSGRNSDLRDYLQKIRQEKYPAHSSRDLFSGGALIFDLNLNRNPDRLPGLPGVRGRDGIIHRPPLPLGDRSPRNQGRPDLHVPIDDYDRDRLRLSQ